MDSQIRDFQKSILKAFSTCAGCFALAGGTALELFYLKHRFSFDLDLFSVKFSEKEIRDIISVFKKQTGVKVKLVSEMVLPFSARVKFFSLSGGAGKKALKIDFVEEVLLKKPKILHFDGIPVYSAEDIYYQKIASIAGTGFVQDQLGREISTGRNQARDAFDVYYLSNEVTPLHVFLKKMPANFQRGMVSWYQSFSRGDLKISLLDLDIYDKKFDSRDMISHLDSEIKKFIKEAME
ncbi:MAG: nucleotidyl transferase AbiEii/AbiGii toxin family protein [Candidatus Omnitrophica bacterium]|jgi:predicted nucleotidyltransferase component of viral defense system|nr:nucleotidyl transferase AbiEii/AbiGii toxin family protein [Candidatus Omnitrophota bacterium]